MWNLEPHVIAIAPASSAAQHSTPHPCPRCKESTYLPVQHQSCPSPKDTPVYRATATPPRLCDMTLDCDPRHPTQLSST